MRRFYDVESKDFESKKVSQTRSLIVLLNSNAIDLETNSAISKANNLNYRIQKPEYTPPLNIIQTIETALNAGNTITTILDHHIYDKIDKKRERVILFFKEEDFSSKETFQQIINHNKHLSACSIHELISMLVGTRNNTLPPKLLKSIRNSHLYNTNTIVKQTLDQKGITYTFKKHQNDAFTCEDVSKERNIPLSQILKCMVGKDTSGITYAMLIPGNKTLKIRKLRHLAGGIKIDLIPSEELTVDFGLTVGAISPLQFIERAKLGQAKFYIDETVLKEEYIDISSGSLDSGFLLKTQDLIGLIAPTICDIISNNS